jgi:hypothetical protein
MLQVSILLSLLFGATSTLALRGGFNGRRSRNLNVAPLLNLNFGGDTNTAYRHRSLLSIFDWDLVEDGVEINFNSTTPALDFYYNLTGGVPTERSFVPKIFMNDCKTAVSGNALTLGTQDSSGGTKLSIQVEIDYASVATSSIFELGAGGLNATISFCVRVDDMYQTESIYFHETNVTVTADLTAGFKLEDVLVTRLGPDGTTMDASITCDVEEYFCDEDTFDDVGSPTYAQGDSLIGCIVSSGDYQYVFMCTYHYDRVKCIIIRFSLSLLVSFLEFVISSPPIWIKIRITTALSTIITMWLPTALRIPSRTSNVRLAAARSAPCSVPTSLIFLLSFLPS